ncbi:Calx-beta domain-containing protein [Flavivirga abyssicola]|uniref:T9SS type A sorting domain-containing protein n=1 Tax=Flavivirga abyssicola TaxID=3063533 RepID=UPI0026DECD98|nr:Calx-beta domain-containing protein [Flavivirga sp. MEBiC07777]WVK15290.1 Calx-beta domain-containing protein [Flavivirga sp. MEBiC07777]
MKKTTFLLSFVLSIFFNTSSFSQSITILPISNVRAEGETQVAIVKNAGVDVGYIIFHADRRPVGDGNHVYLLANYYNLSNTQIGSSVEPLGGGNSSEYDNANDWQLVTDNNLGMAASFEQVSKDATGFYTVNTSTGAITEVLDERAASGLSGLNGSATVGILNNGNLIFVYANAYSPTAGEISFDIINPNTGSTIISAAAVTTQASNPTVTTLPDGGFFIAYAQGTTVPFNTKGKRYDASGTLVGSEVTIFNGTATVSNTTETILSNGYVLIQESGKAKIYDFSGGSTPVQVGGEISILPGDFPKEENVGVKAFKNGGFVAAYVASDNVNFQNLAYRIFDNNGNPATSGQIDITSRSNFERSVITPDLATFSDGSFVVSFGNDDSSTGGHSKLERAIVKNMYPVIDLDFDNSSGGIGKAYTAATLNGQSGGVAIADSDVLLTDADGEDIFSITIDISNQLDGVNEFLTLASATGVTVSGSGTKTLTLTNAGSATKSNFQNALAAIRYENISASNTTTRSIVTTVTDNNALTSTATTTIAITTASTVSDTTAPVFENSTPSQSSVDQTTFTLETDIDEAGTIYYVVVANGASAPNAAQVKAGTDAGNAAPVNNGSAAVNTGGFTNDFSVTGLTAGTAYDVYVVAEDTSANLQTNPTKIDVTTNSIPVVAFTSTSSSGAESVSSADLEVSLSTISGSNVSVNYVVTGTATGSGTDYTLANGTLTITAGDSNDNITIASIVSDAILEANETVIVTISSPTNATLGTNLVHTYTINNDDSASVTIANVSGNENDGAITVTATLDNAVQDGFTVDVSTADGTATTADSDYSAVTSQTLTFTGNASETQTFTVTPTGDTKLEANETITISQSNLASTTLSVSITDGATVTVNNDDAAAVTIANVSGNENDGAITVTATLDNAVQDGFTVDVSTADGTATTADSDYSAITSQTLTFTGNASETQTFTVTPTGDTKLEANETITISQSNLAATTLSVNITDGATVTVDNDDAAAVTIANVSGNENDGAITVTATLDNAVQDGFTVDVSTADGTATTADSDYSAITSQRLTFTGNASETQIFTVTPTGDTKLEANETITVSQSNLASTTLAVSITDGATITVDNDDAAAVTIANVSGNENDGAITVTATLDNAVQGGFTVDVSTADGTATTADNDYSAVTSQTLIFTGNASETQTFTVTPTGDTKLEANETITVSQSNLSATTLSVTITDGATVTIDNDDAALGVEDISLKELINLYPNPVTNKLYIKTNHVNVKEVALFDILGKAIKNIKLENEIIDFSTINVGIYLLKIQTDRGTVVNRIIKK